MQEKGRGLAIDRRCFAGHVADSGFTLIKKPDRLNPTYQHRCRCWFDWLRTILIIILRQSLLSPVAPLYDPHSPTTAHRELHSAWRRGTTCTRYYEWRACRRRADHHAGQKGVLPHRQRTGTRSLMGWAGLWCVNIGYGRQVYGPMSQRADARAKNYV